MSNKKQRARGPVKTKSKKAKIQKIVEDGYKVKRKISLSAKTENQKDLFKSIKNNIITVATGPPGSGKTLISVVCALESFFKCEYGKIIFTRPCIEADGENLGFLPGDLNEKISPYMMPIFDFLSDYMEKSQIERMILDDKIMTLPLAFMRGYAQPLTSQVLTTDGFKNMGDIKIGDNVISENGDKIQVDGVYPQGELDVYKVMFSDGSYVECCGSHLWATKTLNDMRYDKDFSIRNTLEIKETLKSGPNFNHRIPMLSSAVSFNEQVIPIDPYLLGALLGDGSLHETSSIKITTADEDMVRYIEKSIPKDMEVKYASKYDYRIVYNKNSGKGNPLKKAIKELGLLGSNSLNKFIPDIYKINTTDVRLEILRGLLDTDGCIFSQKDRNDRVQYYSISEQLAQDVLFIVQSLGGVGNIRKRITDKKEVKIIGEHRFYSKNDIYIVEIKLPEDINPFKINRKSMKYNPKKMTKNRINRIVKEVIPIGKKECQCISVNSDKELYITDNFIITHNTFKNAFVLLDECQNTTPKQMKMFLTRIGENCKVVMTGDPNQSDIRGANGLTDIVTRLEDIPNIGIVRLGLEDVVRHEIVKVIEKKYHGV